uniref:Orf2 n=1 Tax=Newfield virus TaxID=1654354 RepID=A0A2Z4QKV9_9VIRU|nr:orf2 [Newfield virus]
MGNGVIFLFILISATTHCCTKIAAERIKPTHPKVKSLGYLDSPYYVTDSCDKSTNVSITLGTFQFYVKSLPSLQCVEILTSGVLTGASCSLPPHCGEVVYTTIKSGFFSSVGRCEGLGFTNTINSNENSWLKGWKLVYNVSFTGTLEAVSDSVVILYDFDRDLYEMVPKFSLEYEYMKLIKNEVVVPTMLSTDDTRFCRERVSPSSNIQLSSCVAKTLDELPCSCRLPAYTSLPSFTSETDKMFVFNADQAFSYRMISAADVPTHVRVEFFDVHKGLYVICPAYTMSGSIATQYLKGLGSALASSILAIIGTVWQYVSVLLFEFLSVALTPTVSSAIIYASVAQVYLYKYTRIPHPYMVLIISVAFVSLFSLIIVSLH